MATETDHNQDLKYLGFIKIAAVTVMTLLSNLYEFAKEKAGPHLGSGVSMVEGSVKSVVGPVYQRFSGVPLAILVFVDEKVDATAGKLNEYMPSLLKHVLCQAHSFMSKVMSNGFMAVGKDVFAKYELIAEEYAVKTWWNLNQLPFFPQVAVIVVPTASHWSEKYNDMVRSMSLKGYTVFDYLPLVPIDKIEKVFNGGQDAKEGVVIGEESSSEGSS